jgi:hypothetical protein
MTPPTGRGVLVGREEAKDVVDRGGGPDDKVANVHVARRPPGVRGRHFSRRRRRRGRTECRLHRHPQRQLHQPRERVTHQSLPQCRRHGPGGRSVDPACASAHVSARIPPPVGRNSRWPPPGRHCRRRQLHGGALWGANRESATLTHTSNIRSPNSTNRTSARSIPSALLATSMRITDFAASREGKP